MNDTELDALLSQPLPEMDAADFSVALMERVTQHEARPARILSWITAGIMLVVIAAACLFGAVWFANTAGAGQNIAIPATLTFLACLLSWVVMQTVRE
jgi:hypothetical protein